MCFSAWRTKTVRDLGKSAHRLAPSTARRCCGSCQSGMAYHCCPAILGKPKNPQSWEVQACIRALSQVRSAVIVDVGQGNGLQDLTELRQAIRINVVEMTVLGLARAKANMQSQRNPSDPIGEHDVATQEREFLVGMQPRGTIRDHGVTATEEAAEYLDCDIAAVITTDAKLCSELLEGLGLRKPNRANAKAIATLADLIQEALEEKSVNHGTRTA